MIITIREIKRNIFKHRKFYKSKLSLEFKRNSELGFAVNQTHTYIQIVKYNLIVIYFKIFNLNLIIS